MTEPVVQAQANSLLKVLYTLLFLFFIQQLTFLVESIYTMNLLHTSMDAKALGLLFLGLPLFLKFVKPSRFNYQLIIVIMFCCIVLSPLLPAAQRIITSGFGSGLFLLFLGLSFSNEKLPRADWGQVALLATLLSITFRVAGYSQDISITGNTIFISWVFVLAGFFVCYRVFKKSEYEQNTVNTTLPEKVKPSVWPGILGLCGSFLIIYFALSSPGVIARWTETSYKFIHVALYLGILVLLIWGNSLWALSKAKHILFSLNLVFILLLLWNIVQHRISFPSMPNSSSVVVGAANTFEHILSYLMLLFAPIVFFNISFFSKAIRVSKRNQLTGPLLVMAFLIIVTVFMLIFTNVWGYTKPVSAYFRNQFHLPFIVAGALILLPFLFIEGSTKGAFQKVPDWSKLLSVLLIAFTLVFFFVGNKKSTITNNAHELKLMTYNIQQGIDLFGNKNYEGQLEIIKEINPDILCLQESDGSRISGGNSDVVYYFAEKLGYHSYFGPKTVTGTFGTAILSRFPLHNCTTIFSYSNKDEIGTAVASIYVGDQKIIITNSHPAGNDNSKTAQINEVVKITQDNRMVVALGDYNFKQWSPQYKEVINVLKDSWLEIYPDAIGNIDTGILDLSLEREKSSSGVLLPKGKIDMTNRIDHIFVSPPFNVKEAHYIPAPESGTDHPLHWVIVTW